MRSQNLFLEIVLILLPFTLPVKLEDSPASALGNYPQGRAGADIFANLVSKTYSMNKVQNNSGVEVVNNNPNTSSYSAESLVGNRWFETKDKPVMYLFGYGITYAEFQYSNLGSSKKKYDSKDLISLSFDLENAGSMLADEVVQVYVHRLNSSIERPKKELKAFSRVTLSPGERKTVTLDIPVESLQYWNENLQIWDDDLCNLELQVGASVQDIKLKKEISLM